MRQRWQYKTIKSIKKKSQKADRGFKNGVEALRFFLWKNDKDEYILNS